MLYCVTVFSCYFRFYLLLNLSLVSDQNLRKSHIPALEITTGQSHKISEMQDAPKPTCDCPGQVEI